MPLLNQTPSKEQGPSEDPDNGAEAGSEFDSAQIEDPIMDQLQGQAKTDVKRVVDQGSKFLFSQETMPTIFESIRPDDEVPLADEMGAAAVNIMKILFEKSGGSMPGEAVIPAGSILLARAGEFINEHGIDKVTYDIYAEANKIFSEVIVDEARKGEQSGVKAQEQQAPMPQQQPGAALLNQRQPQGGM